MSPAFSKGRAARRYVFGLAFLHTLGIACLILTACRSPQLPSTYEAEATALQECEQRLADPDRPSPELPPEAFLLSPYANLELEIFANTNGTIQRVAISKPSVAGLFDEYTRKWVAAKWKMPEAAPGEPPMRRFIAPIVYPAPKRQGGHYPPPQYPLDLMRRRIGGMVILQINLAETGAVTSTKVLKSSGNQKLDDSTADWVLKRWKFPPGAPPACLSSFIFEMH